MAGQEKRLLLPSPPTPVGNIEHGAKIGTQQALLPVVKHETRQEVAADHDEGEVAHGDGPGTAASDALVLLAPEPPTQIDLRVDVQLLHCQACLLPLKPPIFKCEYGHVVCCYCRGGHGKVCGRAEICCSELDALISAAKVPCSYTRFGCNSHIVYHEAKAHTRACHCAPCWCPEPTCGFLGSPPALLEHFAAGHSWPIFAVRYGLPWILSLPLWQRWHIIVGQEDQSVFLVTLGDLGVEATAVSLVCIRADGAACAANAPQFWCTLSVDHPGGDKDKVVSAASAVSSSRMFGGAPVPGQDMLLSVPQELMFGDMLAINVRIDQVHSVDASTTTT